MPKKTKKQKILAQLHRIKTVNFELRSDFVKHQNPQPENFHKINYTLPDANAQKPVTRAKSSVTEANYAYVFHDLTRITIFTLFALMAQGVLYFLIRTR